MKHTDVRRAALGGRPLLLFSGVALAGAVLLAWMLWGRGGAPARPNVLIITIDTLRADHLTEEGTPFLHALAARSAWFSNARTPVPLTLPAHATLFSGLLPGRHGIRDNTAPPLPGRPDRGYPLLAESFAKAGYETAAFVAASVLDERYGLDSGFAKYRQPAATRAGATTFATLDGAEQVRRFTAWFDARRTDRPFFAWVHLWEPHAPYRPFGGDEKRPFPTEWHDSEAKRYRGEVARADSLVEQLLASVDPSATVVVLTSDHGESLGEHREDTHGYLVYGATMDIPLLLAGPGIEPGARSRPVSLEDVAPTLRRLASLPAQHGDGVDLLSGPGVTPGRVVSGESLYANRLYGWAQQSVATDGRYTLVDRGVVLELFDRRADPGETEPLPEPTGHGVFERLDRSLRRYRALSGGGPEGSTDVGLAGSPYGSVRRGTSTFLKPAENRKLRDVAGGFEDIAVLARVDQAIAFRNEKELRRLLPALVELRRRDRANPAPCLAQGRALALVMGRRSEAAEALREAIRRGYDTPEVRRLLEACR